MQETTLKQRVNDLVEELEKAPDTGVNQEVLAHLKAARDAFPEDDGEDKQAQPA